MDRETAAALWEEMLLFLDMVALSEEFISPPPQVDVAWHAFILHTRDYEAYCRERYGRVIHHQPTGKPDSRAYERAYKARSANSAPVDPLIWPVPVAIPIVGDDGRAATGGGDFGSPGGAVPGGDFSGQPDGDPSGGDFAPDGEAGDVSGGDFGESDSGAGAGGEVSGGDFGGGDSGGSSCGGSSCGGGGG